MSGRDRCVWDWAEWDGDEENCQILKDGIVRFVVLLAHTYTK